MLRELRGGTIFPIGQGLPDFAAKPELIRERTPSREATKDAPTGAAKLLQLRHRNYSNCGAVEITPTAGAAKLLQPRSGDRMQSTVQAVGISVSTSQTREGR